MPTKVKLLQPAPHASLEVVGRQSVVLVDEHWAGLERVELDLDRARQARLVTFAPEEPAQASFDVLRTKVLRCLNLNNWTTVAITSAGARIREVRGSFEPGVQSGETAG